MDKKYKITIPEPCQEDWNQMTPNENGRFCMNCSKTVVDFTSMLPEEIQHYFIQNQNEKFCGHFRKSQLDTITIQIPSRILYTQAHYHKMFLLALFITMGTTLFSCADNEGNKVKIDKIEVVEDNSLKNLDKSNSEDSLSKKAALPLFSRLEDINEIPGTANGSSYSYYSETLTGVPAYESIEISPDYPGGFEKFGTFIKNEFQIPKKVRRVTGEIEVSFVVNKVGTLEQIKVFDNIGHQTGEEIIRVLQNSKKWMPKIIDGKPIPDTIRMNIVLGKDSLNTERKDRKFSKIVSINRVTEKNNSISQIN
ncbi:energy transducer TonB [Flavobacterium procerum]|uniref:Energy transducer TonB n=1 Tax=Flavobacterium procerum TaxID=1455569 RepID=A0ABV6BWK4_9FLAO